MHVSTYTMRFNIRDEPKRFLYNSLSGSMDLVEPSLLVELDRLKAGLPSTLPPETLTYFKSRGYLFDTADDEEQALRKGYDSFVTMERNTATRFFIVPTYNCNARCPYCFVHELIGQQPLISDTTIEAAFRAMDEIVARQDSSGPTQLVFFGGEPFIDDPAQIRAVEKILDAAARRGYIIDAVTNGFDLGTYAPLLADYGFNKAQVTFDGLEQYANKRRPASDGRGKSHPRIVESVDTALRHGLQINARILLDKESIGSLPDIVDVFDEKGWFDDDNFGAHVGSTYDCFDNLNKKEKSRYLSFYEGNETLIDICRRHPRVADKIKIDFHGARQFLNTGLLPPANYRSCVGATKTFAFDLHGDIFLCESTVGKQDCRIGVFEPGLKWDEALILWFDQRNVLTLNTCKGCSQGLLCAGGCPFTGQVKGSSLEDLGCRGMKDTLEYGLNYYWPRIKERMVKGSHSCAPDLACASEECGCNGQ